MKKLFLTSALCFGVIASANAANIINENPLYRPSAGTFYSVTDVTSEFGEDSFKAVRLATEFGYGITDQLAVNVFVSGSQFNSFDEDAIEAWGFGASFRYLDDKNWKADLFASGRMTTQFSSGWDAYGTFDNSDPTEIDGGNLARFKADEYAWNWNIGTRAGYTTSNWTIAGLVSLDYNRFALPQPQQDVLDVREDSAIAWRQLDLNLGLEGQFVVNSQFNLVGALNYKTNLLDRYANTWLDVSGDKDVHRNNMRSVWGQRASREVEGKLGVNYNINDNMFTGAYMTRGIVLDDLFESDIWGVGARFGVQF